MLQLQFRLWPVGGSRDLNTPDTWPVEISLSTITVLLVADFKFRKINTCKVIK